MVKFAPQTRKTSKTHGIFMKNEAKPLVFHGFPCQNFPTVNPNSRHAYRGCILVFTKSFSLCNLLIFLCNLSIFSSQIVFSQKRIPISTATGVRGLPSPTEMHHTWVSLRRWEALFWVSVLFAALCYQVVQNAFKSLCVQNRWI